MFALHPFIASLKISAPLWQSLISFSVNNQNNILVNANVKIEYFDANGNLVDVSNDHSSIIPAKGKSYVFVSDYEKIYSTYKLTVTIDTIQYDQANNVW